LNRPPDLVLILLPFLTSIFLKFASSLLSTRVRNLEVESLLNRYKPDGAKPLLTADQLEVLHRAISGSTLYVAVGATLLGSLVAELVMTIKSSYEWYWWIFLGSLCFASGFFFWAYSRPNLDSVGALKIPVGNWVLILSCVIDGVLALLSILSVSLTATLATKHT
jgi:hypothetical protein